MMFQYVKGRGCFFRVIAKKRFAITTKENKAILFSRINFAKEEDSYGKAYARFLKSKFKSENSKSWGLKFMCLKIIL